MNSIDKLKVFKYDRKKTDKSFSDSFYTKELLSTIKSDEKEISKLKEKGILKIYADAEEAFADL